MKAFLIMLTLLSASAFAADCDALKEQFSRFTEKYQIISADTANFSCPGRAATLTEALIILEETNPLTDFFKGVNGIDILAINHPIAAMSFDLETRRIQVYDGGIAIGPLLMASSLFHEIRHKDISTHTECVKPSPLAGAPACDDELPPLKDWKSGGSYVYELAFQREAIQRKIPGYEAYIRQFIGNLHIRFSHSPDLAVIDEWIGPELMVSQKAFIQMVRARFILSPLESR